MSKKQPKADEFYGDKTDSAPKAPPRAADAAKPTTKPAAKAPAKKTAKPAAPTPKAAPKAPPRAKVAARRSQLADVEMRGVALSDHSDVTADVGINEDVSERQQLLRDIDRIRSMRKPFGSTTQKLALSQRSGYKRHWFSDEPGRVVEAEANGWTHILDKGKPINRVVGRSREGGPLLGYAMEIPRIFWDEDKARRIAQASGRVEEIRKNPIRAEPGQAQASDRSAFYGPKEGILRVDTPQPR